MFRLITGGEGGGMERGGGVGRTNVFLSNNKILTYCPSKDNYAVVFCVLPTGRKAIVLLTIRYGTTLF